MILSMVTGSRMSSFLCAAAILAVLCLPSIVVAGTTSTYDIVVSGKSCKDSGTRTVTCDYRVGKDLHFTVDGIGGPWTGITFIKSDYEGDFYATYGTGYGCIIVKPGKTNWKNPGCGGPGSAFDYAFISLKSGNVYRDWEPCMKER